LVAALRLIRQDLQKNKVSSLEHVRKAQIICDDLLHKHQNREELLSKEIYDLVIDILQFDISKS